MSEAPSAAPKAKKSVALSGVTAGNTVLCTVGVTGNDLHYRGYDILEIANTCEFEEIAYLLVHGKLPTRSAPLGPSWTLLVSDPLFSATVGEGDPTRVAAQVVTGIGFLGAGVIL